MDREILLLGVLRREKMHGYQLAEFIDHNLAYCTDLKKPTAYFLLERMRARGWVLAEDARAGNRPTRRVFSITPAGEAAFEQLLRENLSSPAQIFSPFDSGLAFIDSLPPEEAQALLSRRLTALEAQAAQLARAGEHPHGPALAIARQRAVLAAEISWLEGALRQIQHSPS